MNITRKLKRSVLAAKIALCPPPTSSAPWAVVVYRAANCSWLETCVGFRQVFYEIIQTSWLCDAVICALFCHNVTVWCSHPVSSQMTCSSLEFPVAWAVVRASDQCLEDCGINRHLEVRNLFLSTQIILLLFRHLKNKIPPFSYTDAVHIASF